MADGPTLEQVSYKLDSQGELIKKQGEQLNGIQKAIQQMAVQDKEIKYLQYEQQKDRQRLDDLCSTDGVIAAMKSHQASCPRGQIKVMWYVVIPMGVTQLATAAAIVSIAFKFG